MNKFLIFLIIIIFIILLAIKIYSIGSNSLSSYSLGSRSLGSRSLEHLTNQSDEAIQNLASLYNKDELTIGKLNVTGDSSVTGNITGGTLTDKSMGKTVKEYIDSQIANLTNQINGVSARVTDAQNGVDASVKKNAELKLRLERIEQFLAQATGGAVPPPSVAQKPRREKKSKKHPGPGTESEEEEVISSSDEEIEI